MSERGAGPSRRPAVNLLLRICFALFVAAAGFVGVEYTLGNIVRTSNPKLAHELAPNDGRITATLASSLLGAPKAEREHVEGLAQLALRQDPTAVSAVSTLGLLAQIHGDTASARRWFAFSERLSRRDLQTELWLIEDAVRRGDIHAALKHYDIALRTSDDSQNILFPVLASAISNSAVRDALAAKLATKPLWFANFIAFLSREPANPDATAALFTDIHRLGVGLPDNATSPVVDSFIQHGEFDKAWEYYSSYHPNVDRNRSRDPNFVRRSIVPSLLDWQAVSDSAIVASIQPNQKGGVFDFAAPATIGGPALQQVQMLTPGRYRLTGAFNGVEQPTARPYWKLVCLPSQREVGRVELPVPGATGGRFSGLFDVPQNCSAQMLSFVIEPSDQVTGISGSITAAQLSATG